MLAKTEDFEGFSIFRIERRSGQTKMFENEHLEQLLNENSAQQELALQLGITNQCISYIFEKFKRTANGLRTSARKAKSEDSTRLY